MATDSENLIPSAGRLLGTNGLQAAVDKLADVADKFNAAISKLKSTNVPQQRYGSIATGSTSTGNGWAGKSNGGGAVFTPGSQGSGWAGKAIGGTIGLLAAGGLAARKYSNKHMAEMTSMDYASNYFSQGTGLGIGSFTGLYQNQRYAQNASDLTAALLQQQYTYGTAANPNNAYFNYQIRQNAAGVGFDPTLSATQMSQIGANLGGWSNYYRLRMYGINTISGGRVMGNRDQASALSSMLTGNRRFNNMNQVNATFGQNSNMAWTLKNMGFDDQTIQYLLTQGRANAIGSLNGYSASQMTQLMAQYETGGTAASRAAGQTLTKMGFTNTMLQSMNSVQAANTSRTADLLPGFSRGVQDANQALTAFKNTLTDAIKPLASLLGFGAGAGGVGANALSGITSGVGLGVGMKVGGSLLGRIGIGRALGAGSAAGGELAGGAGALGVAAPIVGALGAGIATKSAFDFAGNAVIGHHKSGWRAFVGHALKMLPLAGSGAAGIASSEYSNEAIQAASALQGPSGGATTGTATGGAGSSSAATGTMGAGKTASALLSVASRYIGVPYKWGGNSPETGFDCSGFVQYCFAQLGVKLPRVAADQQKVGSTVSRDALQPGDLVFVGNPAHHVAIVYGNGTIIEAPHTGAAVRIRKFSPSEFTNAKRILGASGNPGNLAQAGTSAGATSNRLSSFGIGGDLGSYGSVEEVDALSGAISGLGVAFSGLGSSTNSPTGNASNGMGSSSATNGASGGLLGVLQRAGFSGSALRTAYAVMMAESNGRSNAHNMNTATGDNSYGLFQINMLGGLGPARLKQYGLSSNNDLLDALTNAEVAYKMSNGGTNWNAWSTYKNGAYKKYLNSYDKGAWDVTQDQVANVHKGEMVLSARDADTVRQALMKSLVPAQANGASSGDVTLQFNQGSINVTVQGVMDQNAASDAGKQIVNTIMSDTRIKNIRAGKLNG